MGYERVISAKFLPWFEASEGLAFVDAFEFQGDGVLPKCVAICLVKFQSMFDIAQVFDTEHELGSINTCLISVYHQSHLLIILNEVSGPLPCRVLAKTLLDSVGD